MSDKKTSMSNADLQAILKSYDMVDKTDDCPRCSHRNVICGDGEYHCIDCGLIWSDVDEGDWGNGEEGDS
jgi:DNA-directed RNA polymerase subunit RPC12/RpoP